jgi:hypothetical protein
VLAIDGEEVRAGDNYWRILNHALNEYVPLRVAASADGRDARDVRIRSITSINDLMYEEWVARNREYVERESGGRIAYVHIRSMNQPSLERFRNEINQFWNAQGIVIDIRYNGGGNIDQELIDILSRGRTSTGTTAGPARLGAAAAPGHRRAEGHAHQLALGHPTARSRHRASATWSWAGSSATRRPRRSSRPAAIRS